MSKNNTLCRAVSNLQETNYDVPKKHLGESRVILSLFLYFLIGIWFACIQHLPCLLGFWGIFGGSGEVWTKSILFRFIEGQIQFGMPRGGKLILVLNAQNKLLIIQIQLLPPSMHKKWKEITKIVRKQTNGKSCKSPELKDNSSRQCARLTLIYSYEARNRIWLMRLTCESCNLSKSADSCP